jgi:hypothetical protein
MRQQSERLEIGKNLYSTRVVEQWYKIPADVKKSSRYGTAKAFKNLYKTGGMTCRRK